MGALCIRVPHGGGWWSQTGLGARLALVLIAGGAAPVAAQSQPPAVQVDAAGQLPDYLRDRGTGVATSMFGTYVRKGELLFYPFFEWYADADLEYEPRELGYELGHRPEWVRIPLCDIAQIAERGEIE